jgi:NADH-quinone oxidoreductase subunit N
VAGTTNLPTITEAVAVARASGALRGLPLIALVMVVAGLGFRITAVPFHFYAPDVYQGTATPSAALLAFVPKVVGFLALGRLLGLIPLMPLSVVGDNAPYFLWILAVVTMSLGNMVALMQNNVKRLLAYSSVAHAGYMLIGLSVAPHLGASADAPIGGVEAVLFYLVAYGAMTIGAFAILTWVSSPTRPVETVEDLSGLGRSHPGSALLMTLFLFSLVGLPLTAGFIGKLFLFLGALRVPYSPDSPAQIENARLFTILVVIAAVNSAIGGWYYLRLVAVMYLRDSLAPAEPRRPRPVLATILVCAAVTLAAGVYPAPLTDAVKSAVRTSKQVPAPTASAEQPNESRGP